MGAPHSFQSWDRHPACQILREDIDRLEVYPTNVHSTDACRHQQKNPKAGSGPQGGGLRIFRRDPYALSERPITAITIPIGGIAREIRPIETTQDMTKPWILAIFTLQEA